MRQRVFRSLVGSTARRWGLLNSMGRGRFALPLQSLDQMATPRSITDIGTS